MPAIAAYLNSHDAFIVRSSGAVYLWCGRGVQTDALPWIRALGESLKSDTDPTVVEVREGSEPPVFWELLGGREEYASAEYLYTSNKKSRLFELSLATGDLTVEEVLDYCQDDLSIDYIYMLDTHFELYLWIGSNSSDELYKAAMEVALDYGKKHPDYTVYRPARNR